MNMMTLNVTQGPDLLKNGKTLKQFRDEILERTAATGHYNGLDRHRPLQRSGAAGVARERSHRL